MSRFEPCSDCPYPRNCLAFERCLYRQIAKFEGALLEDYARIRRPDPVPAARCAFCSAEFATFDEARAHANTHEVSHVREFKVGDVIRGRASGDAYVVTAVYEDRVTAVRTVDVTNPSEWIVLRSETT